MSRPLADQISKKFIARSDAKAIQRTLSDGRVIYTPHTDGDKNLLPWTRSALESHLSGEQTFGHYVLDSNGRCKLFTLDVDLKKSGLLPVDKDSELWDDPLGYVECADLRAAWKDRSHVGRSFIKFQFHAIAQAFMRVIHDDLELPCAAAYSGNKGIHVYAFTGLMSAEDARAGAQIVLDTVGNFEPIKGKSFFGHTVAPGSRDSFYNFSVEVYPKQDSPDTFGHLVRLPLGRNLKNPKDPTFFIDMTSALNQLRPIDPLWALTDGSLNPWRRPGE